MARGCGCVGSSCGCKVIAGTGVAVSGTGTQADPYVISANSTDIGGTLQVDSTTTVTLTRLGSGKVADPYIIRAVARVKTTDLLDVADPNGGPIAGDTMVWVGTTAAGHWEFQPAASGGGSGTVTSVAGVAPVGGNVPLTKANLGLGSVDNTSDSAKPISVAVQNAIDQRVNKAGAGSLRVWAAGTVLPTAGMLDGDLFPLITG